MQRTTQPRSKPSQLQVRLIDIEWGIPILLCHVYEATRGRSNFVPHTKRPDEVVNVEVRIVILIPWSVKVPFGKASAPDEDIQVFAMMSRLPVRTVSRLRSPSCTRKYERLILRKERRFIIIVPSRHAFKSLSQAIPVPSIRVMEVEDDSFEITELPTFRIEQCFAPFARICN